MSDFIEKFTTLSDNGLSPERFRRWAAICTVAALLNRKVWTSIRKGKPLFPNLYTLLVGLPASGKTQGMLIGRRIIETQSDIIVSPDSGSNEMFVNILADGEEHQKKKSIDDASSIAVFLSEWGNFMAKPDNRFCALMAHLYDCDDYKHSVLYRGTDLAEDLYVNICSCCTPSWFTEGFPANSWEQGLPSRFQFIWGERSVEEDRDFIFEPVQDSHFEDKITNALFDDACRIALMEGFMAWSKEAGVALNTWRTDGFPPVPVDPMLSGYCGRRALHVAKIATIMAASSHPKKLVISIEDFESARDVLLEAETVMPRALILAGGNLFQGRIEAIYNFVKARSKARNGKSVPEYEVRECASKLVPPQMIRTVIEEMLAAKRMKATQGTSYPNRDFYPN